MKNELKIWWTLFKGLFVCQHYASNLEVIRLTEQVDEEDGYVDDHEVWMTRSLCKCGKMVDQKFAFSVDYKNRTFNSDGIRYEDLK